MKKEGDDGSVGLEILQGVSELEERVRAIDLAVKDSYFTFTEALQIYKVSKEDYIKYKNGN